MKIEKLIQSPDLADKLLSDIDEIARSHCSYGYGLPLYSAENQAELREAVYKWIVDNDPQ